jgi:hypothetical protein
VALRALLLVLGRICSFASVRGVTLFGAEQATATVSAGQVPWSPRHSSRDEEESPFVAQEGEPSRLAVRGRVSAKSRDARFVRLAGRGLCPPTCDFRWEGGSMGCLRHVAFSTKRDFDGALPRGQRELDAVG